MKNIVALTTWFYLAEWAIADNCTAADINIYCYATSTSSEVACYNATTMSLPSCCHDRNESMVVTCSSLDSAFDVVAVIPLNVTVNLSLSGSLYVLSRTHAISDVFHITIQAVEVAVVNCNESKASVIFNFTTTVTMEGITWNECGSRPMDLDPVPVGGIMLLHPVAVNVRRCAFGGSSSSGVVLSADDLHHGELDYSFVFEDTQFYDNGRNYTLEGGGLIVDIGSSLRNMEFRCVNCSFHTNKAQFGGGAYLNTRLKNEEECSKVHVTYTFIESSFTGNKAIQEGGAVYFNGERALFHNCTFESNEVEQSTGGALHMVVYGRGTYYCYNETIVNYTSCTWQQNKGWESAAILMENSLAPQSPFLVPLVHFTNSQFISNAVSQSTGMSSIQCIVYLRSMTAIMEDVYMYNNTGSALCSDNALLYVQGNVSFVRNAAYYGGGIILLKASWIVLPCSVLLSFTENSALYGGAIYQSENYIADNSQISCIFSFETCSNSDILVNFTSNHAHISGNSVFFNDPTSTCSDEVESQYVLVYPSSTQQFTSFADNITFLPPTVVNDTMEIILGQQIALNAMVLDYFNQPTFAFVSVIFNPDSSNDIYQPNPYYPSGFISFSLQNGSNSLMLTIAGPEIAQSETVSMYSLIVSTVQQNPEVETSIHFVLTPCPLGFVYNDTLEMCACAIPSTSNFNCDLQSGTACLARGYWLGNVSGTDVISICTSGYCSGLGEDCIPCANQILNGTCLLPMNETAECLGNRTGILCTECSANFSFTFGALNCVPDHTCTADGVLISILMILSDFFLIAFLSILLKFDYSLHSGTMFCFIYYFSVINTVLPSYMIPTDLKIIVSVIKSFTQLDPHYLGHIPVCFSIQLNYPLVQLALLYVNPIIISISVPTIIFLLGRCPRSAFRDNTAVRAISLLFLLSFTALTETSFLILKPLTFPGADQTVYVSVQPSTVYLDPAQHLWLFIIAVLLISLLIIPFTFFLLLAPCLVRCINLVKIKPFLDEFQSSYKDQFRWMAGFYFLCRLIYLILVLIPSSNILAVEYGLQFVSVGVATFHAILQPYKTYWLNLTDSLLLVDIALISLLYGITGDFYFKESEGHATVRTIVTYMLVLFPLMYALVIIVLGVVQFPSLKEKLELCRKKLQSKFRTVTTSTVSLPQSLDSSGDNKFVHSRNRDFREPLLGLLASEDIRECVVRRHSTPPNLPNSSLQTSTASSRHSNHAAIIVASCTSQSWQDEARSDIGSDL